MGPAGCLHGPFGSPTDEPQPPLAVQAADPGAAALDGADQVGMARMDERPGAFAAHPAMPVGELLQVMGIEAATIVDSALLLNGL